MFKITPIICNMHIQLTLPLPQDSVDDGRIDLLARVPYPGLQVLQINNLFSVDHGY